LQNFGKLHKKYENVAKFIKNYGNFANIPKKNAKIVQKFIKNFFLVILAPPRSAPGAAAPRIPLATPLTREPNFNLGPPLGGLPKIINGFARNRWQTTQIAMPDIASRHYQCLPSLVLKFN